MTDPSAYSLLADPIRRVLWDLGWEELRPIQHEAIRLVLNSDSDLIISARTASGKTEAAFLPILSAIISRPRGSVRALYVGPLRALINDQFRRLEVLCQRAEISVHRWHGDVSGQDRKRLLADPGGVLLITPESIEALFVRRSQALRSLFHDLSFVVIDELHAMEGSERGTHLRSLLCRLERYCSSPPRFVALSATLGDPQRSARWLRPDDPGRVQVVTDDAEQKAIRFGVFVYETLAKNRASNGGDDGEESPPPLMSQDMFEAFGADKNLIFANSKADVEWYSDELNQRAARDGRPGRFLVHHGALSKEIREHTERSMQDRHPFSTVCTSSLELGIDIGNVTAVGQIGCPWSVASMVQRLGRSGRRDDQPQIMRLYLLEEEVTAETHLCARLRPQLLQSIALTELMLEKWVEPPRSSDGDLSTLVQQILSTIKETGGLKAAEIFDRLVVRGAFRTVSREGFVDVLRSLGHHDLIEQSMDGDLILGLKGEELVGRYEFFSAFATPPEYRVVHQAEPLGTLPTLYLPGVGDHLLLAGRRWQVVDIDDEQREVAVRPATGRKAPLYVGWEGPVHDAVRKKMKEVLLGDAGYPYLYRHGQRLLDAARQAALNARLRDSSLVSLSASNTVWFPWVGTNALTTLQLVLDHLGLRAWTDPARFALQIGNSVETILDKLGSSGGRLPSPADLASNYRQKRRRKYDEYLTVELLDCSIALDLIDLEAAAQAIDASLRPSNS